MSVFGGVGERTREGNDLFHEMKDSGVLAKTALVFGQMNEPPGARARVGLSALTVAEFFREQRGQDVLLFIDNVFPFTLTGSEMYSLVGRMPSAALYQPTLRTEMGAMQERITSTDKGSITPVQAVYVPKGDPRSSSASRAAATSFTGAPPRVGPCGPDRRPEPLPRPRQRGRETLPRRPPPLPVGPSVNTLTPQAICLLSGEVDHIPEPYFNFKGGVDEVIAAAQRDKGK